MDTIKAIQVFVEIAQQGSLTKAADKLSMSRAMVSRYLEYLENRFGARLMQRNTRRVSLTQAGEEALGHCQTILEQEQMLSNLSAEIHTNGVIRVTAAHYLSREYLLDAIVAFNEVMPNVQFDVVSLENTVNLMEHNIDVSIRISNKVPDGYESQDLGEMKTCLVASPEYLQQCPELTTPLQLKNHRCLVHSHAAWQSWVLTNEKGQTRSFPIHSHLHANDVYVLLEMALRHQGITRLPKAMVLPELRTGRLVEVLPNYQLQPFQLAIVYVSSNHTPQMVQNFIEFLLTFFANHERVLD